MPQNSFYLTRSIPFVSAFEPTFGLSISRLPPLSIVDDENPFPTGRFFEMAVAFLGKRILDRFNKIYRIGAERTRTIPKQHFFPLTNPCFCILSIL